MGFFKKERKGGKCGHYAKGGGMKGTDMKMRGYTIFPGEKQDGGSSKPITRKQ